MRRQTASDGATCHQRRCHQSGEAPQPPIVLVSKSIARERLAPAAGITTGSLARIELGRASPSWETCRRIAGALGLSVERLAAAIERERAPTD